jgi:hypothetical protein
VRFASSSVQTFVTGEGVRSFLLLASPHICWCLPQLFCWLWYLFCKPFVLSSLHAAPLPSAATSPGHTHTHDKGHAVLMPASAVKAVAPLVFPPHTHTHTLPSRFLSRLPSHRWKEEGIKETSIQVRITARSTRWRPTPCFSGASCWVGNLRVCLSNRTAKRCTALLGGQFSGVGSWSEFHTWHERLHG